LVARPFPWLKNCEGRVAGIKVVFNGGAGDSSITPDKVVDLLKRAGHEPVMHLPGDGKVREFLRGRAKLVVAAGGDGTVGKIALALAGRKTPLAILPLGTANNIAGSLGVPLDLEAAIHAWPVSDPVVYDSGVVEGPWGKKAFVEGFGIGAFADLVASVHEEETAERTAALRLARDRLAQAILDAPDRTISLTIDGEERSLHAVMVEVLNIGLLGPRMRLAPGADPQDGKFELVVIRPADRQPMADWLRHQSPQHEPPPLMRQQCDRLKVRWPAGPARFDGKAWKPPARTKGMLEASVSLRPKNVRFLVPREAA